MKFVFWQNIISIHQSAFLNALTAHHELTLVVEKDIEEERKGQGWSIPGLEKINIVVAPTENQMVELLNDESIHVFSGITAYPIVYKAFRHAVKNGLKIGVMLEPYDWRGIKGKLRYVLYKILKHRYNNNINFILTTGENGVNQYKNIGFNTDTIFHWGYFVKNSETDIKTQIITKKSKPNLLFVGRIDDNKNLLLLIDIVKKYRNLIDKFTIVGDGPLKTEMLHKIEQVDQIEYKGIITNDEVINQMRLHDILILPSKYDGWGAVVNEALHVGMRVIASENCGASVLLDGDMRGEKFRFKGDDDFERVLLKWIKKGSVSAVERLIISDWANKNISGIAAAEYFERIIKYVYYDKSERPIAPWKS